MLVPVSADGDPVELAVVPEPFIWAFSNSRKAQTGPDVIRVCRIVDWIVWNRAAQILIFIARVYY